MLDNRNKQYKNLILKFCARCYNIVFLISILLTVIIQKGGKIG